MNDKVRGEGADSFATELRRGSGNLVAIDGSKAPSMPTVGIKASKHIGGQIPLLDCLHWLGRRAWGRWRWALLRSQHGWRLDTARAAGSAFGREILAN